MALVAAALVALLAAPPVAAWQKTDVDAVALPPEQYAGIDSIGTSLTYTPYTDFLVSDPTVTQLFPIAGVSGTDYRNWCMVQDNIGFNFPYYGRTVDKVGVSVFGYIVPTAALDSYTNCYNYLSASLDQRDGSGNLYYPSVISGLSTYFYPPKYTYCYSYCDTSRILSKTTGPVGDRTYSVQYQNMVDAAYYYGPKNSFEIRLFERDGHIEVRYKDVDLGYGYCYWFGYCISYHWYQVSAGITSGTMAVWSSIPSIPGVAAKRVIPYIDQPYCYKYGYGTRVDECKTKLKDLMVMYFPAPQIKVAQSVKIPCRNEPVSFSATYTSLIGAATEFRWSSSDMPGISKGTSWSHTFAEGPKNYTVWLNVDFPLGYTPTVTIPIHVNGCIPPTPVFDMEVDLQKATIKEKSFDTDGKVVKWHWDFGDKTTYDRKEPLSHTYKYDGVYDVKLTVTDNEGFTASTVQPAKITGLQRPLGQEPVADAGDDQTVAAGTVVHLDGTGGDADRARLFRWMQVGGPEVTLTDAESATPSFTAQLMPDGQAQVYGFALTIDDGFMTSDPDVVVVNVQPPAPKPTADAGTDQIVLAGALVSLDGTDSKDAQGNPLTFAWRQVSGPAVELSDAAAAIPMFRAPAVDGPQVLVFEVKASNGERTSDAAEVRVEVDPVTGDGAAGFTYRKAYNVQEGLMQFQASLDLAPEAARFFWDFGDGTATQEGANVAHAFASTGTYTVTLTAKSPYGETAVHQQNVAAFVGPSSAARQLAANAESQASPAAGPLMALAMVAVAAFAARRRRDV